MQAVVLSGNTLYVGGSFSQVGPGTGGGVAIDSVTGGVVSGFPKVTGRVLAVVPDGAGGWYIGGRFTAVEGKPRANIAHILADNSVAAWNPSASGSKFPEVLALAVNGSTVYAGGTFTNIGGQARSNLAAIDATTGSATAWNPGASGSVRALAVSGSTVYAGGSISTVGGQTRHSIAAISATTGAVTPWNPDADATVRTLAVSGNKVYVGGSFGVIGGQVRTGLAALDVTTGFATAWDPNGDGDIYALAVIGSVVYAGGTFTVIGGQTRNNLAAIDTTNALATAWNPNANAAVFGLTVSGSRVYAGGTFTTIGGQARTYLAAIDTSTGVTTGWNPKPNDFVRALAASGSRVFAGGDFTILGVQTRNNLAAIDATTGVVTAWNPNADFTVYALAVSGSTVYAGGFFSTVGGQTRNNIAAISAATGIVTTWNPNANNTVYALAVSGSTVYAGGSFTTIGGLARNRIAALDTTAGLATAWNPDADNRVAVLVVAGNIVYAGGDFTTVGGLTRNRIAAIRTTTGVPGVPTGWDPNANGSVLALVVRGSTVYSGGSFSVIGGQTRNQIAAIDTSSGLATAWNPNANPTVVAVAVDGATVYAGGSFTVIGGKTRNSLAALGAGTGTATAWNPNPTSSVLALAVGGSTVFVGGMFPVIGNLPLTNLAAINGFCPGDLAVGGSSVTHVGPEVTVTGDFDRDGKLDVAAAVTSGAQVLHNMGSGVFDSLTISVAGGSGRGIATADFNDDGALDLALGSSRGLYVMLGVTANGSPTGTFASATAYVVGTNPSTGVAVADFNEDGINDLAVAVTGADSVAVLLGQGSSGVGNGGFNAPTRYAVATDPLFLAIADFNSDGIWDMAVTDSGSASVSVLLGQGAGGVGNGTFAGAVNHAVDPLPRPIVAGDFNEDGITDLAIGSGISRISVLLGTGAGGVGDGSFATNQNHDLDGPARDLEVADFDGDGRADLGVALGANGGLQYLYGDGAGTTGNGGFLPAVQPSSVGGYVSTLDVNEFGPNPGDPRAVVARLDSHELVTLTGGCAAGTGRTLELTSPNGGETLTLGTNVPIQWSRGPLVLAVHVELSRDNGVHWERLASNLFGGEFRWTVAPPGTTQGRLRVVDVNQWTLSDASNGTFAVQPLVGVLPPGVPLRPSFSMAYPNPSHGTVRVRLRLPSELPVKVEVFDLAGRRVRNLTHGLLPAGEHTLMWDGRTDGGSRAADGIYFVRGRTSGLEAIRRVVRIE